MNNKIDYTHTFVIHIHINIHYINEWMDKFINK